MTCPAFGSTSEVAVYYAVDPDPSAAMPDTTQWNGMRMAGESLNLDIQSTISDEITSKRSYADSILTSGQSGGAIQFELSYDNFEDFFIAVLQANKDLRIAATRATLDTGVVGSDNAISWVANALGTAGNAVTVTLVDPAVADQALSVAVVGSDITVNLATNGVPAVVSTAAEVIAAVNADPAAGALLQTANTSTSDGSGVVAAVAQTNLASGAASSNPWLTTEAIANGSTKKCLAFMVRATVGATTYNYLFRGQQVDSMSLNLEPGAIARGEINIQGLQGTIETDLKNWTFHPADTVKPLMSAIDSLKNWAFTDHNDTLIPNTTFQSLQLTFSNSMRQQQAIGTGSIYAAGVASSRFMAEMSATVYFANGALYQQLVDNNIVKLAFDLEDSAGAKYNFDMDKMKVQSGVVPLAGGPDQDMLINPAMRAFEDATKGTVTITKTDAP